PFTNTETRNNKTYASPMASGRQITRTNVVEFCGWLPFLGWEAPLRSPWGCRSCLSEQSELVELLICQLGEIDPRRLVNANLPFEVVSIHFGSQGIQHEDEEQVAAS